MNHPVLATPDSYYTHLFKTIRVVLDPQDRILDIDAACARQLGLTNPQSATGQSLTNGTPGRVPQFNQWLTAARKKATRDRHVQGTGWVLLADGWQYVFWTFRVFFKQHAQLRATILTGTLPYAAWVSQIDYQKQRLNLAPFCCCKTLDRKDLEILTLDLNDVPQKMIATMVNASVSTVEYRLRKIKKLLSQFDTTPHAAGAVLNAAALDVFLLANDGWLDYALPERPPTKGGHY